MRHGGFVGLRSFDPTVHQGTSNNTLLRLSERCGARAKVGPRSGTALTPPVVRATTGDDAFVIRRKRARGVVYSGPSTTVIKKKRYVHYREPSHAVIIKKRRPAIAVRVALLAPPSAARPRRRCATPARRARTSVPVPAFGNGRPVLAMLARAPAGGVAKMVNLQPAAAPEAAAPHKTWAPATRPAAASSALVLSSSRVGSLPARELAHWGFNGDDSLLEFLNIEQA